MRKQKISDIVARSINRMFLWSLIFVSIAAFSLITYSTYDELIRVENQVSSELNVLVRRIMFSGSDLFLQREMDQIFSGASASDNFDVEIIAADKNRRIAHTGMISEPDFFTYKKDYSIHLENNRTIDIEIMINVYRSIRQNTLLLFISLFTILILLLMVRRSVSRSLEGIVDAISNSASHLKTMSDKVRKDSFPLFHEFPTSPVYEVSTMFSGMVNLANSLNSFRDTIIQQRNELIEREKLQVRFEAITRTTQMIAHDLKKPFSSLLRILQNLSDSSKNDAFDKEIASVVRMVDDVDHMIKDILSFESHEPQSEEPCQIKELILRSVDSSRSHLFWGNVKFIINDPDNLQWHVDSFKMERVFVNLLNNAVESMHGNGMLTVSILRKDSSTQVDLHNTNSYIPQDIIAHMFEPFFTYNKKNGTGLGLAISKKVVSDHRGSIECSSDKLTGTTFTISIPSRRQEIVLEDPILLIDDDIFLVEYIQQQSTKQITHVRSLEDLRLRFENNLNIDSYKTVITDMYFHESDYTGEDIIKLLKDMNFKGRLAIHTDAEIRGSSQFDYHFRKSSNELLTFIS